MVEIPWLEVTGYLLLSLFVFRLLLGVPWIRETRIVPLLMRWLGQFAIGAGVGIIIILLTILLPLLLGHYQVSFGAASSTASSGASPSYLSNLSLSQALGLLGVQSLREEAYFRGIWMLALVLLLGLLSRPILGRKAFLSVPFQLVLWGNAALLSSAMFALFHADNPSVGGFALFNIFLAGMLFSVLFAATRSLTLIWGLHFAWNYALALLGLPVSGYRIGQWHPISFSALSDGLTTGGAFGPEASIPLTVVLIIVIAVVARTLPAKMRELLGKEENTVEAPSTVEPASSGDE